MTFGSSYREVRKTEGSRNRDSTVASISIPRVDRVVGAPFRS